MTILPHQSSLSRAERERIRRAAQIWTEDESQNQRTSRLEKEVLALCAALEQAERERDEAKRKYLMSYSDGYVHDLQDSLAKVPALVEATAWLVDYCDANCPAALHEMPTAHFRAFKEWEAE